MNTKNGGPRKAHIRTLIDKHIRSSDPQTSIYTLNDGECYAHTQMCLFFSFFHFCIFILFFLHIYKCTHPEHEQMNPKDNINNG